MLTAQTITRAEIESLEVAAGIAGDSLMVHFCRYALTGTSPLLVREALEACADAINMARAMDDENDDALARAFGV